MIRRLALPLVGALLLAAGVAFAWWGFRAWALEREHAASKAHDRARTLLDEAVARALEEAAQPSTEPEDAWLVLRKTYVDPPLPGIPEALLVREAEHLDLVCADPESAVALLLRLSENEDAGPWQAIAALRAAAIRIRLGRPAGVRRLLDRAAKSRIHEEGGLEVRLLARYHLAVLDVREGRTEGIEAFLAAARDGRHLSPSGQVGSDDLILALHRQLLDASPPHASPPDSASRRLGRVRERVERGLGLLADLPEDGLRVTSTGWVRRDGRAIEVRDHASLIAGLFMDGVRGLDIHPTGGPADRSALSARLPAPLADLEIRVWPASPPAGTGTILGLLAGLLVYVAGCTLGLVALRRSQRVAAMQSDFVAAVSHELKTPIASVRAMAEFLADGPADDVEKVRDYARRIEGEMERLGRTVGNVLDVARVERTGRLPVVLRPDDPAAIVTLTCEAIQPTLEARGFSFAVDARPAAHDVPLDRAALQSVLMNLIDNAAKFSPDVKSIQVDSGPAGRTYRIEVKDRGRGLPPSGGERLFRRFVRATAVKKDAVPGVGLGLYVVREIVEAHGGSVRASARKGGGSVFTVELPLADATENMS